MERNEILKKIKQFSVLKSWFVLMRIRSGVSVPGSFLIRIFLRLCM